MPKVYLSNEERRRAENESRSRKDDKLLMSDLRESKKAHGLDYQEIARRSGVSTATVCKAFNEPAKMQIDILRRICYATGVRLEISTEGG